MAIAVIGEIQKALIRELSTFIKVAYAELHGFVDCDTYYLLTRHNTFCKIIHEYVLAPGLNFNIVESFEGFNRLQTKQT